MSIQRWAQRRDTTEPSIVDALTRIGVRVWRCSKPFDLLCWSGNPKRFWWVECKTGNQPLTPDQQQFLRQFEAEEAAPIYVCRSVDEALAAAAEVGQWR